MDPSMIGNLEFMELMCQIWITENESIGNDGITRSSETCFKRANSKNSARRGARNTHSLQEKNWLV